jgi:DNA polymerase
MTEISSEIHRYFQQRKDLYPGDFFRKPENVIHDKPAAHDPVDKFRITSGNKNSNILFLCHQPSKSDIEKGDLISGEAGILFDKILKAIDLSRKDVYITSLRSVSKEGKLSKEPQLSLIEKLVDENRPKLIVSLGEQAGSELFGKKFELEKIRGKNFKYKQSNFLFTYHPELVRKNEKLKRPVWEDFKMIRDLIKN